MFGGYGMCLVSLLVLFVALASGFGLQRGLVVWCYVLGVCASLF